MKKVNEVALFTDNVPGLTGFYRQLLDMEPAFANEHVAVFSLGDQTLLIHTKGASMPGGPPNEDHFAFGVRDVEQEHIALREKGLAFEVAPRAYDWGKSAYLRDPDGRLVELHEE
jgi:catechol 2,3-dioxygenase-like lactoylglutathione lyase family enzyme